MVEQTLANLNEIEVTEPVKALTMDAGYFSEENMAALDANDRINNLFIATGRQKHNERMPASDKEGTKGVCSSQGDH
ncbi:MAG: hypothetical protein JKY95_15740 [Planctomycetaceae bacterium]|nr:hypothetical protein [Planctomycetaceae bacterium]